MPLRCAASVTCDACGSCDVGVTCSACVTLQSKKRVIIHSSFYCWPRVPGRPVSRMLKAAPLIHQLAPQPTQPTQHGEYTSSTESTRSTVSTGSTANTRSTVSTRCTVSTRSTVSTRCTVSTRFTVSILMSNCLIWAEIRRFPLFFQII